MKGLFLVFCLIAVSSASPARVLQILRILSPDCSNNGYLWKNQCFCLTSYTGSDCSQKREEEISDDTSTKCGNLIERLDNLYNISPEFYLFDDDEFPRITINSVDGSNTTGPWIPMHSITSNFHIFSNDTSALDIGQGGLGDCYLLAAFASLANRDNGTILKNMFVDVNDNPKHVYVTRWLINGKPRFVAVDDWVPGSGRSSWFSHVEGEQDFWPLILEKDYAKIHGTYDIISGGWQTAVWSGISQARTFDQWHSSINSTDLFYLIDNLFKNRYIVGAATVSNTANNEVNGHAYSVLGAYEVTTDNGTTVKLIRYFNPWHVEVWKTNPWGDNSANWTNYTKSQVPYLNGNDGIVFSTVEDYHDNFGVTNWAEIQDDYDISFIDIAFNNNDSLPHGFEVNFTYFGNVGHDLYIFNDESDGRLLLGCPAPVSISSFIVTFQNGTVYRGSGSTVKIANATPGVYKAKFNMQKNQNFVNTFTLTAYAQYGKVNFIPPANNVVIDYQKKQCPNACNLQGSCNSYDGTCRCYFGYQGSDCSQILNTTCTSCNGQCDQIFGICVHPGLFNLGTDNFLNEGSGIYVEMGNIEQWEILSNGLIHNINNNKYLDVANLKTNSIITYSLNNPLSNNQNWNVTYLDNNSFIIQSNLSKTLAVAPALDSTKLTFVPVNKSDPRQQWSWKVQGVSCPGDCSGNGVCSITTGTCVCGVGFVGDACNFTEGIIECPNNCSGNGVCNTKTGYCNCQKEYVGEDCSFLYQDIICPSNCSNHGTCSLQKGCLCNAHFDGPSCQSFFGNITTSLQNVNNGLYLGNNLVFSATPQNWNITLDNHLILPLNGKCIDVSGNNFQVGASLVLYWLNSPASSNQMWVIEPTNDIFIIKAAGFPDLAISLRSDGKSITLDNYDSNDTGQQWKITY